MRQRREYFCYEKQIIKNIDICVESIYVGSNCNADEYEYRYGRRNVVYDG